MFNCKEDDSFVKGNIIQLITFNEGQVVIVNIHYDTGDTYSWKLL